LGLGSHNEVLTKNLVSFFSLGQNASVREKYLFILAIWLAKNLSALLLSVCIIKSEEVQNFPFLRSKVNLLTKKSKKNEEKISYRPGLVAALFLARMVAGNQS
jgi:hypothetical protein